MGGADQHCVMTLVDRKAGYVFIGKLPSRSVQATNRCATRIINKTQRRTKTITLDNGTEFHGYKTIEAQTGATVYFATPHHSWGGAPTRTLTG